MIRIYFVNLLVLVSIAYATGQVSNETAVRTEGKFAAVTYEISGTLGSVNNSGVCWGTSNSTGRPNIDDDNDVSRSISTSGTYRDSLTSLNTQTTYYFRAFITIDGVTTYTPAIDQAPSSFTTFGVEQPSDGVLNLSATPDSASIKLEWDTALSSSTIGPSFYYSKRALGGTAPPASSLPDANTPPMFYNNGELTNVSSSPNITYGGLAANTTYSFLVLPAYNGTINNTWASPFNVRQDDPATITVTSLKGVPTTQASSLNFTDTTSTSFTIEWTRGNGDQCAVFVCSDRTLDGPTEDMLYTSDSSWNNTTEQCVYVGTGTSVTVTNINDKDDYTIKVFEFNNPNKKEYYKTSNGSSNNPITLYRNCTWTGTTDSAWNKAANWGRNSIPDSNNSITIPDQESKPVISNSASAKDITIQAGGELTITSSGSLTVSGDVTIESSSSENGALINQGTNNITINGNAKYNLYIADDDNFHLASCPTTSSNILAFTAYTVDIWDEPNVEWDYLTENSTVNVMEGYNVRHGGNTNFNTLIEFSGSNFNDGSQSIGLTNSNLSNDSYGFNLVGNPYPSAIDWDVSTGWTRTNVNATIYQYIPSSGGFYQYSHSTNTGDNDARYAQAGQAFFVFCETSNSTLTINNDARTSSSVSFLKNKPKTEKTSLALNISNGTSEDNAYVVFFPGATEGYDSEFDGPKFFALENSLPQIYSIIESDKLLAINALPKTEITEISSEYYIPIGLKTETNHTFTFSISDTINFPDSLSLLLVDYTENERVDLLNNNYEFYANAGTYNERFAICISPKSGNGIKNLNNSIYTYIKNSELFVNQEKTLKDGKIIVTDILGKTIINKPLTNGERHRFKVPKKTNIFVVNIYSEDQIVYRKKLINIR